MNVLLSLCRSFANTRFLASRSDRSVASPGVPPADVRRIPAMTKQLLTLAIVLLGGWGAGASGQTAHIGTVTTTVATGLGETSGVALDGSGNVYVTSDDKLYIYEAAYSNGTYTTTAVVSFSSAVYGIAADAAGDLFAALSSGSVVK